MKICFIADSKSIHVNRIVAYFVRQGHQILVISTAVQKADIAGVMMAYVLPMVETSSARKKEYSKPHRRSWLRQYISGKFKGEQKLIIRRLFQAARMFSRRKETAARIREFLPSRTILIRAFPEGLLAFWCRIEHFLLRTAGSDISYYPTLPIVGRVISRVVCEADAIITESEYEKLYLQRKFGVRNPIDVIPIGTEVTLFGRDNRKNGTKYGLRRDSVVVISNRYLEGFYNGFLVIEAFVHAKKLCSHLELLYVCPSPITDKNRGRIRALRSGTMGIHILEGPISSEEMAEVLSCGDIWVSFSSVDGIPNSMLEAMSCGLVPIVGDIPQLREWVQDGHTGFVVPLNDVTRLGHKMAELGQDRERLLELSVRCREKICRDGSYEKNMQRMVKFVLEARSSKDIT